MVEDNIATLDKIMNKSLSLEEEEEEEEDITGSDINSKTKVIPVVASWGYNTHEQLINVINQDKYLVLPALLPSLLPLPLALTTSEDEYEDNKDQDKVMTIIQKNQNQNQMSSNEKAKYCKETDPTGSSLSIIFHNYRNN
ncbi:hypothetical protein FRACYDRAFT_271033 [Fragilariopsis cylindrus CCMP1102]|uniref:Uncharacterized protein n=1 Tax=Fragilariopsis cylindrus CCMP1102 TaxID=635003 RepID=A0A1E7EWY7_9STRA|nr:hypothetical protein FRACYDRAFT_271033 [Fragilariopsis cylindrus CCMP1102]|eukprot:OEU10471.1 hypothetical protein FRACYDRAFT_271033 [Fragilariopsis cylindrus CCMP1102]